MIKVLTIIGTRPEAIKLAPVLQVIRRNPERFDSQVLVTGQHREMLSPMLELFEIEPDHDLAVMTPGQSPEEVVSRILAGMSPVLQEERPDWILVQGDTTTTMAAGLASFYQRCPLAHVEAGLRTFDKYSPFPEELNRRIASVIADIHFAPTRWAATNLLREGVPRDRIRITGNTVIDAMDHIHRLNFDPANSALADVPFDKRLLLVTAHRQENFGPGMTRIARGLRRIAERHPEVHLVYPVHMNPRARGPAFSELSSIPNVSLLDPLEYQPLVWLLHRAHFVITDSGGIQEEAAAVGKPVLVLRESTERPEGVDSGIARLIGADTDRLVYEAECLLEDEAEYSRVASVACPYGDGLAAERIGNALSNSEAFGAHEYERPRPEHPFDDLLHKVAEPLPVEFTEHPVSPADDRLVRAGLS